ncbi:hypothetical protein PWG71_09815 [Nocardiopsis sp. N85]|uniref:hypothetical protein n=1 Tax=Nocardiopsis sp. N85 TaxID=3029400 RepID=UPI00237F8325|nr:hypothetical protein [Nocardiopsis sp. N85]MDE3721684.1 hypothetical protein [Nocardiopsis sp. N85]
MKQSTATLLGRALRMVGALLFPSRGRHSRSTFSGLRRRSQRVRRYAANPEPARRATVHLPVDRPHARPLTSPPESFPADDVALVRPYYAAHERAAASRNEGETEAEQVRVQAEALARLERWTAPRIPRSRPTPPGDLLAPDPAPAPVVAPARGGHRTMTRPANGTSPDTPFSPKAVPTVASSVGAGAPTVVRRSGGPTPGFEDLEASVRTWPAQRSRKVEV